MPDETYNILSGVSKVLTGPTISFDAGSCFSVTGYEFTRPDGTYVSYITFTGTEIEINTNDQSLVGINTFQVKTVLNNGEKILKHSFSLTLSLDCSALIGTMTEDTYS